MPPSSNNVAGTIGFVLSLLGLLGVGCLITSIAGCIVSYAGTKQEPKGLAVAGLIMGILGLVMWGILILVYVLFFVIFAAGVGTAAYMGIELMADYMPLAEANQAIVREWDEDHVPNEQEGNELIAGRLDRWDNQIRYDFDGVGYKLRSAGKDGMLDNSDDLTIGPFESMSAARRYDVEDSVDFEGDFEQRFEERFENLGERFEVMGEKFEDFGESIGDEVEEQVEDMEKKFDDLGDQFDRLEFRF